MARPHKIGLDFFPVYMDIYEDDKILLAEEIVDPDANQPWIRFAVSNLAIRLLREIYKEGYFIPWNDRIALTRSSKMGAAITSSILNKIVSSLVASGFFSADLFAKYGILTSRGIQKKWVEISKSSRRQNVLIPETICLCSEIPHEVINSKNPLFLQKPELLYTLTQFPPTLTQFPPTLTPSQHTISTQINISFYYFTNKVSNTNNSSNKNNIIKKEEKKEVNVGGNPVNVGGNPVNVGVNPVNVGVNPVNVGVNPVNVGVNPVNVGVNYYDNVEYKISYDARVLEHPIETCLWNYLNNSDLQETRNSHCRQLQLLGPGEEVSACDQKLNDWACAFNRKLVSDGVLKHSFLKPSGGWITFFVNWAKRIHFADLTLDPNTLFTENEKRKTQKTEKKSHILSGNASEAEQQAVYRVRRNSER